MVLISFKDLYKIDIFPKFHRCGSKIVPATPIWSLNFKRAWQAQFLSHTHETLEKYVFYIDLEMILVPFFEIHDGIWDKNFVHCCHIHILSHPCSKWSHLHRAYVVGGCLFNFGTVRKLFWQSFPCIGWKLLMLYYFQYLRLSIFLLRL